MLRGSKQCLEYDCFVESQRRARTLYERTANLFGGHFKKSSINANAAGVHTLSVSSMWTKITSKNSVRSFLAERMNRSDVWNIKTPNKPNAECKKKKRERRRDMTIEKIESLFIICSDYEIMSLQALSIQCIIKL